VGAIESATGTACAEAPISMRRIPESYRVEYDPMRRLVPHTTCSCRRPPLRSGCREARSLNRIHAQSLSGHAGLQQGRVEYAAAMLLRECVTRAEPGRPSTATSARGRRHEEPAYRQMNRGLRPLQSRPSAAPIAAFGRELRPFGPHPLLDKNF